MFEDGPKRNGRFLKAGSRVLEKVSLQDFAFHDLSQVPTVPHDNAQRSIIHSKYHDAKDLDQSLKSPDKFDDDLAFDKMRRPILVPMDFTKDWERERKMRKNRVQRLDDEDAELDFEAALRQADAEGSAGAGDSTTPNEPAASGPSDEDPEEAMQQAAHSSFRLQKDGDSPGFRQAGEKGASPDLQSFIPMHGEASAAVHAPNEARHPSDFSPLPQQSSNEEVFSPEDKALSTYRDRMEQQQQREEEFAQEVERMRGEIAAYAEKAQAEGYRDGFRLGEEKAELKAQEIASQTFGKVGELVEEMSKLKTTILEGVQENFYEICQALAEALLQREFSIHPESFAAIVRRAISETVNHDEFTIKLHPSLYDRLSQLHLEGLDGRLTKDSELAPGDFRIESKLSVVDVNLRQKISELLAQADLDLFDKKDLDATEAPASNAKKVG